MPTYVETTAAMNPPAEPPRPAAAAAADLPVHTLHPNARRPGSAAVSPNSILGALAVALVTAMFSVLMWQINSLGNRIDGQSARIDALSDRIDAQSERIETLASELRAEMDALETGLRAEMGALETGLRAEMGSLRAEMHAGFREVNATLLDHTDRLARLEAAAGLPRHIETPESPTSNSQ